RRQCTRAKLYQHFDSRGSHNRFYTLTSVLERRTLVRTHGAGTTVLPRIGLSIYPCVQWCCELFQRIAVEIVNSVAANCFVSLQVTVGICVSFSQRSVGRYRREPVRDTYRLARETPQYDCADSQFDRRPLIPQHLCVRFGGRRVGDSVPVASSPVQPLPRRR